MNIVTVSLDNNLIIILALTILTIISYRVGSMNNGWLKLGHSISGVFISIIGYLLMEYFIKNLDTIDLVIITRVIGISIILIGMIMIYFGIQETIREAIK